MGTELTRPLELGVLLRQAHRRAALALDAALEPISLGGRHFGILLHLLRLSRSTHTELIALTGGDKAGMARTIDALVEAGLVTRQASSTDRRVMLLTLTELGTVRANEARDRALCVGRALFADFTPNELDQLIGLLQRFVGGADSSSD